MQITVHLDTARDDELHALAALIASLGGAAPTVTNIVTTDRPTPAAPPPPAARPETPKDAAEALMQHEANRVAAAPPPPAASDNTDGNGADPASLDADGIPWDARIHSTPAKRNADSTWRKKRGLDEVTYGQVHAELQAAQAAGNPGTGTTTSPAAPNGSPPVETPPAPPPPASSAPTASAAPPPPPAADVPNAPAPPSANTAPPAAESAPGAGSPTAGRFAGFPEFVQAVNSIRTPTIPYLELNTYAETVCGAGVQFKDLKDRPDAWETFYAVAGGQ